MVIKYSIITTLILMLTFSSGASQELDSLIRFSDLTFISIYEEMVFSKFYKGQDLELEDLFMAIDVGSESEAKRYKSKLNALASTLKRENIMEKRERKQVKIIYENTHEALMVRYEEDALFPDLFRNGNFNCVTGSIIYSLIFKEFDIPYSIQKGMNHVNLVAYPETYTILVESTDSEKGLKTLNKSDKMEYVDMLTQGKVITPNERLQNSITSIFLQYALNESEIDEYELASYQYSNRGILLLRELEYEKAYENFEKAYYLKPGIELATILLQTGGLILHMSDYSNPSHVMLIAKLARFKELGITDDDVYGEFERVTRKVFYDRNDLEGYREAFSILAENLESEQLVQKISLMYYGELIDDLIGKGDLHASIQYLDELYDLDPENKPIQNLIKDILISYLGNSSLSPPDQVDFLDKTRGKLPLVFEMHIIKMLDLHSLLAAAEFSFDRKNPEKGEDYLVRFERNVIGVKNLGMIANEIQTAYKTAAYYYYGRGNIRKTREFLDRGLKILPMSNDLKYMKNSI